MSFFLGSFGKKIEDEWYWEDEKNRYRFQLEVDSKFRKKELDELCAYLQKKLPSFEVKSQN